MTLREQAIAKIQQLPEPLAQEVIDYVDFLLYKHHLPAEDSPPKKSSAENEDGPSFFDLARPYLGLAEGPSDLSTNKKYFEGFGE